ncbi:SDR family NAD(P)-dependent oxidoreductase [Azospirillum agricola]|uniref:SDR family NAD(P)-dependent oxidoreductase n=1 Tax=Azospirillum agricola TaxID=1720247 RepID=UPI000A0F1661|nr:SDR family oxidoreductase [Azospirillum agricola]SMH38753.1 NAD(P)-dependent dehydrogenase, short-chain alcohol dehydrogenase family [Azospirillum lipoferum]
MTEAPTRKPLPLADCGVLITGGTSGVGLATAIQFAQAGVTRIGINGRDAARGAKARAAVLAHAPEAQVEFLAGDCNDPAQAAEVCEAARARLGSVDALVNSTVGPYGPTLFHDIPLDEIPLMVTKQMMAPLLTSRVVVPWMRERGGGAIINIASDAGKVATPGESVLGAAMAGIIMFTRTLAIEGKRDGIRVNVITPSIIEGTITYGKVMNDAFSGKLFGKAIKMAQLGVVQPDDLAALIVFLAGPQAAKLTGQAISVNGGISAA